MERRSLSWLRVSLTAYIALCVGLALSRKNVSLLFVVERVIFRIFSPMYLCTSGVLTMLRVNFVFVLMFFLARSCTWADGRIYRGEWTEGQAHGQGRETNPDGTVRHDGLWEYDSPRRR
jgi:hypothetical protein